MVIREWVSMMKFVALFVFIGALWWSWHLTYSETPVRFDTHASLQNEMKTIIGNHIAEKRPSATNLQFKRIWTETLNPDRVKVSFEYSFEDGSDAEGAAEQVLQGYAILNRAPSGENGDEDAWSLDEVSADTTAIIFKRGSEINN